jgi:hypothetical protein
MPRIRVESVRSIVWAPGYTHVTVRQDDLEIVSTRTEVEKILKSVEQMCESELLRLQKLEKERTRKVAELKREVNMLKFYSGESV